LVDGNPSKQGIRAEARNEKDWETERLAYTIRVTAGQSIGYVRAERLRIHSEALVSQRGAVRFTSRLWSNLGSRNHLIALEQCRAVTTADRNIPPLPPLEKKKQTTVTPRVTHTVRRYQIHTTR